MKKNSILSSKFWERQWENAEKLSSLRINKKNEKKWINFWDSISDIYYLRNKAQSIFVQEIVNFLEKEKIISGESKVLDVGCGPGTYALPLAEKVKEIVAIDPARKMLDVMMKSAEERKITNIIPVCTKWDDYQSSKKFDLVFASLSPAIRSADALIKMNKLSSRYACIVTYSKTNEFKFRDELWKKIIKKPFYSNTYKIIFPFNFLYTSGFSPNVYFFNFEYKMCENIENLAMQYENYFSIFTKVDKNIKNKIYNYFKSYSKNGIVKSIVKREISVMWWNTSKL